MKRILIALVAVAAMMFQANAQKTVDQVHDFTSFTSVSANKYFEIEIVESSSCSAKITVDEIICDYTKAYVKGNTLFLDIDEKSFPKELKSALKGKNAIAPRVKAVVYMPVLKEIALADKAVLDMEEPLNVESFKLSVQDNASVKKLMVGGDEITVNVKGKAQVRMDVNAKNINYSSSGNSNSSIIVSAASLSLVSSNSSVVKVEGKLTNAEVKAENSSEVTLTGICSTLRLRTLNLSTTYADGLVLEAGEVVMDNGSAWINAKDYLKVDLDGGYLVFNGSPKLDVVKVKNASLLRPADDKKRKK